MAPLSVCSNEETKKKNERPQTSMDCRISGGGEVVQRSLENLRPSSVSKILPPNHRDKESLLDELIELKNAVLQQAYHTELHIQHNKQVQEENKQLEKSVENLELAYGLEAPRVGGESKLTSKLLGLKAYLHEKQEQYDSQKVEIGLLQKDIRVTHSRELVIERELFAAEVGQLQKSVRGLGRIFVRVNSENDEIQRLRKKNNKLENRNKELESTFQIAKKRIEDAKSETEATSRQSVEENVAARKANSKFLELASHSLVLQKLKRQEELEAMRLEHAILKVGDNTRKVLKDKIAAEKPTAFAQDAEKTPSVTKKWKVPEQPRPIHEDAMARLEVEFLSQVQTASVEFVESVPASQIPYPKNETQIEEEHKTFETRRNYFANKVEEAETAFLMAMEAIEYGEARTKPDQSNKKLQEDVARLQAELDRMRGMGSGNKRWKNEKVSVTVGDERLKGDFYKAQVADKGAEIDVDIDITKVVHDARAKATAEAKRLGEAWKKAQGERDKLASELAKMRDMGSGGKRWKSETVAVVVGDTKLPKDDYKCDVLDQGAGIDINVLIHRLSKVIDEVEAAKMKLVGDKPKKVKKNVTEALQHLDNIAAVVTPKASSSAAGPSKT